MPTPGEKAFFEVTGHTPSDVATTHMSVLVLLAGLCLIVFIVFAFWRFKEEGKKLFPDFIGFGALLIAIGSLLAFLEYL